MRLDAVSVRVHAKLFLVRQRVPAKSAAIPSNVPVDFLLAVDVSGSMSGELEGVRADLKRHLRENTKASDTVSLVAFSGNGQCYSVFDAEPVASLPDVDRINKLIDRWLTPVGMTNFVLPFEMLAQKLDALGKDGRVVSVLFQSDGCETCGHSLPTVLGAVDRVIATGRVGSFCVVEYGPWADHHALTSIARRAGGVHVHSRDFRDFAPRLADFLAQRPLGAATIKLPIAGDPIEGLAFRLNDKSVQTFDVEAGVVRVPEDAADVYYLSPRAVGETHVLDLAEVAQAYCHGSQGPAEWGDVEPYLSAAYAAIATMVNVANADAAEDVIRVLGDKLVAQRFGAVFGIERILAFVSGVTASATTGADRFTLGYEANCLPPDDVVTIPDIFALLQNDPETRILTEDTRFEFRRIGRKRLNAATTLSVAEQAEMTRLQGEIAKTRDVAEVRKLSAEMDAILAKKGVELRFEPVPAPEGYPIDDLVFSSKRANLSIRMKRPGTVAIGEAREHALKTADAATAKVLRVLPDRITVHDYKMSPILADGRLIVEKLPVHVSDETRKTLVEMGVTCGDTSGYALLLNLGGVPVINRKMRARVTPERLFGNRYRHLKAQAAGKVMGYYRTRFFGAAKRMRGLTEIFGADGAAWLLSIGFSDNGFNPNRVQAPPSTDTYRAKVIDVSIAGLSSLPEVEETLARIDKKGKLTTGMGLLAPHIETVRSEMTRRGLSVVDDKLTGPDLPAFETWLEGHERGFDRQARDLVIERSRLVYAMSEGHVWPWPDPKKTEEKLTIDGDEITGRIKLTEPEVAL